MTVALMPNMTRANAASVTKEICNRLDEYSIPYLGGICLKEILGDGADTHILPCDELYKKADVIIAVGGDGSVIRAVRQAVSTDNLVLGVNAGRTAYLCEIDPDELPLLEKLKTGEYSVQDRMMLETTVLDAHGAVIYHEQGINDIVLSRDAEVNMIDLTVEADGCEIADYRADGVIFATPTGSSAYSLSAGGPIIEPILDATLVTPVCPHSLRIRPYVFSAETEFTVTPAKKNTHTVISVDGNPAVALPGGCTVTIKKSTDTAGFISLKKNIFTDILNKKLG